MSLMVDIRDLNFEIEEVIELMIDTPTIRTTEMIEYYLSLVPDKYDLMELVENYKFLRTKEVFEFLELEFKRYNSIRKLLQEELKEGYCFECIS